LISLLFFFSFGFHPLLTAIVAVLKFLVLLQQENYETNIFPEYRPGDCRSGGGEAHGNIHENEDFNKVALGLK